MDYNFDKAYSRWALVQSLINVIGLLVGLFYGAAYAWFAAVSCWFLIYIIRIPVYTSKYPLIFSYATWITILRLAFLMLLAFVYPSCSPGMLFWSFLSVILLDGVDGFLARRLNQTSRSGEILDAETDAFMVFLLAWIHYNSGAAGWWILIPGGFRFFYELIILTYKDRVLDFPPKIIRSSVAVLFFLALLTPFILPAKVSMTLLQVSSFLIVLSFGANVFVTLKSIFQTKLPN